MQKNQRMGAEKKPKRAQVEPQAQIELKKAKKAQKVDFFFDWGLS